MQDEQEARSSLEEIIDHFGWNETLYLMARVADEKADHIEASYEHSGNLIRALRRAGRAIVRLADSRTITEVS